MSGAQPLPLFTIGHSTRTIPQFAKLLQAGGVELVVDIRSLPRSRTNPQYNEDVLPGELLPYRIGHMRIAALGGLRRKSDIPQDLNALWRNRNFHNYADYALTDSFKMGLEQLVLEASRSRAAIMCAEAVWWRCHRRIVADYLIRAQRTVYHLMGEDKLAPARLTPGAILTPDGIHYPAP
ncbi:MAG TPA: DUF488 domain-containing protein [Rhizomicrobium sp.]|nr:DUF488 domain-containing protein [Rhizomicrobium sp.]